MENTFFLLWMLTLAGMIYFSCEKYRLEVQLIELKNKKLTTSHTYSTATKTLFLNISHGGKMVEIYSVYLGNILSREKAHQMPVKALSSSESVSCWFVLGMLPTKSKEAVTKAYGRMAMVYHPDKGGNNGAFITLQKAKEKALALCNSK